MKRAFMLPFCFLFTWVWLFSLVGCGDKEDTAKNPKAQPTIDSGAAGRVTIAILGTNLHVDTPGIQEDQVAREIERITGITMSIQNVMGDAIEPKILAMNASGDLPDIVNINGNKGTLKALVNAGSIIDCTELVQIRGQNFLQNEVLHSALEFSKEYWSMDTGKLYVIPMTVGMQASLGRPTVGTFIRWDYYKDLGYPQIRSIMDLLPVLQEMQEKHPRTAEGKAAYGVSFWSDWELWPTTVLGFMDGYAEAEPFGMIDISNGEYVPYLDEGSIFWKYIKFYNKAWQMGILDPDAFTQKYDQYAVKVAAGQVYFIIPGWLAGIKFENPEQGYALIDTSGISDKSYAQYANMAGQNLFVISKNSKAPERAMDLLNFFASNQGIEFAYNGVEGEAWDLIDGNPVMKPEVMELVSRQDPSGDKYGIRKYWHMAGLAPAEINSDRGMPFDFAFYPEFIYRHLTLPEQESAHFHGVKLPGEIMSKKKYNTYDNLVTAAMPVIEDKEYIQKGWNIRRYINENHLKLILAEDDEEFALLKQKFISELEEMGWDKVVAKYRTVYEETRSKLTIYRDLGGR